VLNKQGPGKIDWTDYTWNPVTGCLHNCSYCYMQRLAQRGIYNMTPAFHPERLNEPSKIKKPSKFFVSSSGDLFGEWVPNKWISSVFKELKKCKRHTFQLLTKNPPRYLDWFFPENAWAGITIDTQARARTINFLKRVQAPIKFISFEPLLEDIHIDLEGIDWIIIGANSNRGAKRPSLDWADRLIDQAYHFDIPIWVKDNLHYPSIIKEFPK